MKGVQVEIKDQIVRELPALFDGHFHVSLDTEMIKLLVLIVCVKTNTMSLKSDLLSLTY